MENEKKIKYRACVPPEEEIVISGISGIFPKARNVHILSDKLYNKVITNI